MFKRKDKSEYNNLVEQTKKREKIKKEKVDVKWIITILLLSFVISFSLSFISQITIPNVSLWVGIIITLLFIGLGVFFDIIGVSVTSADEAIFNSMSSRKVKGASVAVRFKKNADKVSSFCCDVIGDICGIISGAAGTAITVIIADTFSFSLLVTGLVVSAVIASLTIGGKAMGKSFAINKSAIILYEFAKFVSNFYHK